uniref:Putative secreted peptide n=1 Tax=Anopheles braziliensis TaxID=58242 RepID=A0A2M3ZWP6_9DIPT
MRERYVWLCVLTTGVYVCPCACVPWSIFHRPPTGGTSTPTNQPPQWCLVNSNSERCELAAVHGLDKNATVFIWFSAGS